DYTVSLKDAAGKAPAKFLVRKEAPLKAVAFSGDGKSAYWALCNGTAGYLHVTQVPNPQTSLVEKVTAYAFPVHAERVAVSARGDVFALGAADGTLSLWDAARITPTVWLPGHARAIAAVTFAPDGKTIAQ